MCKNPAMTHRHRIAVLALPGAVALDLGVPATVFWAARNAAGHRFYETRLCTPDGGPVRTAAGFSAVPEHGLDLLDTADTVIVPGVSGRSAALTGTPEVCAALRAAHARGARVMSICTGAFVLAAAGLLDDRPATTHWAYVELFRRRYPRVKLDPDVLFVDDGELLTSAGVGAGVDLCLHVIRRDHGSEVANRAARRCVVPPWRDGGQAQYIERPLHRVADGTTAATRAWAALHLGDRLTMEVLAVGSHPPRRARTLTERHPGTVFTSGPINGSAVAAPPTKKRRRGDPWWAKVLVIAGALLMMLSGTAIAGVTVLLDRYTGAV